MVVETGNSVTGIADSKMNFVFLAGFILLLNNVHLSVQDQGSTPRLKEIVTGRCYDFQKKKVGSDSSEWKDCNDIWEAFYGGFAYKDPCKLTQDDYKPFFEKAGMPEMHDQSMFWSGTYDIAHEYSYSRFTTLEDTLPGYLANGLTFCGNANLLSGTTDGIDYQSCPDWSEDCDYSSAFWSLASTTFAQHARGIARVMFNGSRVKSNGDYVPAYSSTSYFARYELPNLQVDKIDKLMILVIHNIEGPWFERCGRRSIRKLQRDVRKRGIPFTCHDDPDDVRHILCVDYPESGECLFLKKSKEGSLKTRQEDA